jgi:DNA-binding beta-propeller fold protein YncE
MATRDVVIVVQKNDHSIGFYDFLSGSELARVPVPDYPHEFAISPDGRHAYSCHFGLKLAEDEGPGGNEISVVSLAAMRYERSISCGAWRRPHGIAFDASGRLYVLSEGTSCLLVIPDPLSGSIVRTMPTAGSGSHIVSVTRDGALAFCSNMVSDTVSVLAPHGEDEAPIVFNVGKRPEGSAFDEDETRLLVCNRESAELSVIAVAEKKMIGRIATPPGPVRMTRIAGARFAVACYHDRSIIVVDADRGAVTQRVALAANPVSIGIDPHSGLALAGLLPSGLAVADLAAGKAERIIPTRAGPDPMAVVALPDEKEFRS